MQCNVNNVALSCDTWSEFKTYEYSHPLISFLPSFFPPFFIDSPYERKKNKRKKKKRKKGTNRRTLFKKKKKKSAWYRERGGRGRGRREKPQCGKENTWNSKYMFLGYTRYAHGRSEQFSCALGG